MGSGVLEGSRFARYWPSFDVDMNSLPEMPFAISQSRARPSRAEFRAPASEVVHQMLEKSPRSSCPPLHSPVRTDLEEIPSFWALSWRDGSNLDRSPAFSYPPSSAFKRAPGGSDESRACFPMMQTRIRNPVAGIILTGGSSRRMGFDKTALEVDGIPCASRVAKALEPLVCLALEVGSGTTRLDTTRERPAGSGPLLALAWGRAHLKTVFGFDGAILLVAGDMPFVTSDVLQVLLEHQGHESVVPLIDGRAQPLCALWREEALHSVEILVAEGCRSMKQLLSVAPVTFLEEASFPHGGGSFADLDVPADLERLGISAGRTQNAQSPPD
ncbi:MAG: molybdenum cofactor guanylyltransferase [Acidimicrobiales bacterium]